jgi:hypothetical protein
MKKIIDFVPIIFMYLYNLAITLVKNRIYILSFSVVFTN